jgi:hypothetical protein
LIRSCLKLNPDLVVQLARGGFQVTGYRLEVLGRFDAQTKSRPWGQKQLDGGLIDAARLVLALKGR